jgi:hypothetical protein
VHQHRTGAPRRRCRVPDRRRIRLDDKATHDRLAAQFGDPSWYPHLVAANTDHAALIAYLDTRDATVQAEACTAPTGAAASLGRVPTCYQRPDPVGTPA